MATLIIFVQFQLTRPNPELVSDTINSYFLAVLISLCVSQTEKCTFKQNCRIVSLPTLCGR